MDAITATAQDIANAYGDYIEDEQDANWYAQEAVERGRIDWEDVAAVTAAVMKLI